MAIRMFVESDEVAAEAARIIAAKATIAAEKGRPLTIALSGGSTPKALYRLLAEPPYREDIDWQGVHLFFGDERCVPPRDEESNYRMVQLSLLEGIEIPASNVHRIDGELAPREGASRYEEDIKESFKGFREASGGFFSGNLPVFDIVLLGLGTDGHTLSIFPAAEGKEDLASLDATGLLVVDTDGPEAAGDEVGESGSPAIKRVTMTPMLVNNAELVVFMVTGRAKAHAVSRVIDGEEEEGAVEAPARRIKPTRGEILWLLDDEAASLLI
jgi:6-phosphogluconolactonase